MEPGGTGLPTSFKEQHFSLFFTEIFPTLETRPSTLKSFRRPCPGALVPVALISGALVPGTFVPGALLPFAFYQLPIKISLSLSHHKTFKTISVPRMTP